MTTQIQIEPGIAIAPRPRPANARYPIQAMDVGDSFAVPDDVTPNAMRATARFHAKRTGRTFTVRKDDNGNYRLWRTA